MSDRRTFLGNAAAAAVITKISSLRPFGSATEPTISDRAKAELRGPVEMCVEETTGPPDGRGKYSTTTEYDPDGRLCTTRYTNSDSSEWVTTQIYDADGRLQKIISGRRGEPSNELLYAYDGAGRLLTITSHPETDGRTDFQYDEHGLKASVQSFDAGTLKRAQGTSYAGSLWDASVAAGVGVPIGGNIVTIYNKDLPAEQQLHDGQGRIVTRVARNYDANGRIIEEKQIQENPILMFANQFGAEGQSQPAQPQPTAAQLEAMNKHMKLMLSGRNGTGTSYSYDAQGRVSEKRERNFWFERLTTTSYNEQGDKCEERQTMANNLTVPAGAVSMDENGEFVQCNPTAKLAEFPDEFFGKTKGSFAYQYDGYGNWTQQTTNTISRFGEVSAIRYRKLTYY